MALEIERRFLLNNNEWKNFIVLCKNCNEYEEINVNKNKMSLAYNILDLKNFDLNTFSVEIISKCKKC